MSNRFFSAFILTADEGTEGFDLERVAPTITFFHSSTSAPSSGVPFTLSWDVRGVVTALSINQGIGDVTGSSVSTSTTTDKTYTLTAYNGDKVSTATVTVAVAGSTPQPEPEPEQPIDTSMPLATTQTVTASSLGSSTSEVRKLFERIQGGWFYKPNSERTKTKVGVDLPYDPKYTNEAYHVWRTHNNKAYKAPKNSNFKHGANTICRGLSHWSYNIASGSFRVLRDLTILDAAAEDARHNLSLMDKLGSLGAPPRAGDHFGWRYGADGQGLLFYGAVYERNSNGGFIEDDYGYPKVISQHADNTATITEKGITYYNQKSGCGGSLGITGTHSELEESISTGFMITAYAAWSNRNLYSPTYEPRGAAGGPPSYYKNFANLAMSRYESMTEKYLENKRNRNKDRELYLPLPISRGLKHADVIEIASAVAYAKMKGGSNWKNHEWYKKAERAWNLVLGPRQKVGAGFIPNNNCDWFESDEGRWGKCIVLGHFTTRYTEQSGTKDDRNEYLARTGNHTQSIHNTTYTNYTMGSISFMYLEGCDFVTKSFMQGLANNVARSYLNHGLENIDPKNEVGKLYVPADQVPVNSNGNGAVATPSGWKKGWSKGTKGGKQHMMMTGYGVLAGWDENEEIVKHLKAGVNATHIAQDHSGIGPLALYYAVKEGKVRNN